MLARRLVYRFLFPLLLTLGIGGATLALYLGVSPAIVAPAAYFGVVAIVAPLEWIFPYHKEWNSPRGGDVWGDLGATFIIAPVFDGIFRAALVGLLVTGGAVITERFGANLWPKDWPFLAQCALGLVVAEFGMYWFHRGVHEIPILWRFHSLHHNVPRLYWLNNGRFHPFDFAVVNVGSQVLILALLGAPPYVLTLAAVAASICGMLAHANIDMNCGVLNWVFNTPQLHRWHHSSVETQTNSNYCSALVLWDIVFGTRHLPQDRAPPKDVGNGNARFPTGYLVQLAAPFMWSRFGPNEPDNRPPPAASPRPPTPGGGDGAASEPRPASAFMSYLLFPLILGVNAAAVWWFGFVLDYPLTAVSPICYFSTVFVVAVLERVMPYRPAWNRSRGDVWGDLTSVVFMATVADGAFRGLMIAAFGLAGGYLSTQVGARLWPIEAPFLAQLALALVLAEIGTYWTHRLSHELPWLWKFHALHHHVPRLYWLNNGRFHPVDFAITNVAAQVILLGLIGAPADVLVMVAFVASLLGMLAHCNVNMECGVLNFVFQSPQLHRWHHSTRPEEANNNYAFVFPIFDIVFGTRHLPKDRAPPVDLGTGMEGYPTDYGRQLISPFRRWPGSPPPREATPDGKHGLRNFGAQSRFASQEPPANRQPIGR